ncbi:MAG: response regulator [Pseudobacteriovorax sp.]|nr:response regulator [Pseudobacteriovorax sp.]
MKIQPITFFVFLWLSFLAFAFFSLISIFAQYSSKEELSSNIVATIRNQVIFGERSKAQHYLGDRIGEQKAFSAIRYFDLTTNEKIFIGDREEKIAEKIGVMNSLKFGTIRRTIFFDIEESEPYVTFEFYFYYWENILWLVLTSFVSSILLLVFLYKRRKRQQIEKNEKEEFTRNRAIAQTTQMLAHDVRKPFSMVKALVSMMNDYDIHESRKVVRESFPSITAAIKSVEGMIQDIMEVGNQSNVILESVNGIDFIFENLRGIFEFREGVDIIINSRISEGIIFDIDSLKFSRVVQNILSNAVEHMGGKGSIWINVGTPVSGYSTFTIGNSDTFISQEDRTSLFNAFFTKGKKGGTGLGLAIAKKIVEAHGGTISCHSEVKRGTEFIFTIPAKISNDVFPHRAIPKHSSEFYRITKSLDSKNLDNSIVDRSLLRKIKKVDFSLTVLDDEAIYIKSIKSLCSSLEVNTHVFGFSHVDEMLGNISLLTNLVILDVDLGDTDRNGFDVSQRLRQMGYKGKICIHSNRGKLEFQPKAIEAGADFFLPKPMSKNDLIGLLSQCIQLEDDDNQVTKVVLFEDEGIYQRQWKRLYGSDQLEIHESLTGFEIRQVQDYDYVICDYYLKNGDTGIDVAMKLREIGYEKPIFLCSNLESLSEEKSSLFDLIIKKDAKEAFLQITEFLK